MSLLKNSGEGYQKVPTPSPLTQCPNLHELQLGHLMPGGGPGGGPEEAQWLKQKSLHSFKLRPDSKNPSF